MAIKEREMLDQLIEDEEKYQYKIVKPQPLILNKKVISSTYIRSLLEKGQLKKTNRVVKSKLVN